MVLGHLSRSLPCPDPGSQCAPRRRAIPFITTGRSIDILTCIFVGMHVVFALSWVAPRIYYSRLTADDFCLSGTSLQSGWLESQRSWYNGFTPRVTATAIISATGMLASQLDGQLFWVTGFFFLALFSALGLFAHRFLNTTPRTSSAFALVSAIHLCNLVRSPDQSLFWLAGAATYFVPIILFLFLLVCLRGQGPVGAEERPTWPSLACGLLAFAAAGCNEPFTVLLLTFLAICVMVNARRQGSRSLLRRCSMCLIAAAAMAVVMWLAPGNKVRILALHAEPSWREGMRTVVPLAAHALGALLLHQAPAVLGAFAAFAYISLTMQPRPAFQCKSRLPLLLLLVFPVLYMLPTAYVWQGMPPLRGSISLSFIVFLLVQYFAMTLWPAGRLGGVPSWAKRRSTLVLITGCCLALTLMRDLPRLEASSNYVAAYDAQYRLLAERPSARSLLLPPLPEAGLLHRHEHTIDDRLGYRLHPCIALFFHLDKNLSIRRTAD